MSAYLSLVDENNNTYDFPFDFWITDDDFTLSSNIKNIAFGSGGRNTADNFPEARSITIEGAVRADTLAELETKKRALYNACLKGGKLYVSDDTVTRYITVSNAAFSSSYQGDYRLEKPITIDFVCEYPFWQDDTETEAVLAGGTVTIDNSGSDFILLPIITINANQGFDLPSVTVTNESDGNMTFTYNDPNFVIGDILEVDSIDGTVKKNNNNVIVYYSPASFLRLINDTNIITYSGNDATVTVKYRKVYV